MAADIDGLAADIAAAFASGDARPLAGTTAGLDTTGAYAVQRQVVAALNATSPIVGYKAALTAPAAQAAMGLDAAVTGVLLESGRRSADEPIDLGVFGRPMLETEFGFITSAALADSSDLQAHVESIHLMIEIANSHYAGRPAGVDLIAANSAFGGFIIGPAIPADTNLDAVAVSLSYADEQVHAGAGGDVMGGQWAALAWLVDQILAAGYDIPAGSLLMTGSIGGVSPAQAGRYRGKWQGLGTIEFELADAA